MLCQSDYNLFVNGSGWETPKCHIINAEPPLSRLVMAARWFRHGKKEKWYRMKATHQHNGLVCMCAPLAPWATSAHHCLVLSRYPRWVGGPGLRDRQAFCGLSDRLCQMTHHVRCHHGPPWRLPSQGHIRANHTWLDKWEEADWRTDGFNLSAQKTKWTRFYPRRYQRREINGVKNHFSISIVHLKAQRGFCLNYSQWLILWSRFWIQWMSLFFMGTTQICLRFSARFCFILIVLFCICAFMYSGVDATQFERQ